MAESLAVKYRPQEFDEVVGQRSIIKILEAQVASKRYSNAYLFAGASGSGKTTTARIFARKVNKGTGGIIELDAASNNGVDNIRQITQEARERSLDSDYKVFILDECQMLTNAAWSSLLKTLEEPNKYTIFIFCTTDPQKIPATILNRVQRFNFTRLTKEAIQERLNEVCVAEGFTNYIDTISYISSTCNGGMRDALTALEKCSFLGNDISLEAAIQILGGYAYKDFFDILNAVIDDAEDRLLSKLHDYYYAGNDMTLFVEQFLDFTFDVSKYCLFQNMSLLKIPATMENDLKYVSGFDGALKYYAYLVDKILDIKFAIKNDVNVFNTVSTMFLQMARGK